MYITTIDDDLDVWGYKNSDQLLVMKGDIKTILFNSQSLPVYNPVDEWLGFS